MTNIIYYSLSILRYSEGVLISSSIHFRFGKFFDVVDEGAQAAVAAAMNPQFKLRWLKTLTEPARQNVMTAINKGIASCYRPVSQPKQPIAVPKTYDDGFDFGSDTEGEAVVQTCLSVNAGESEFQQFCKDPKNDATVLHSYPIVKSVFLKFNALLPSSASVERLFSFATMFDIAKYNRLKDENFERRVLCRANGLSDAPRAKSRSRKRRNVSSTTDTK